MAKTYKYIWCEKCNHKIRVRGFIWDNRLSTAKKHPQHKDCYDGYYCDACTDASEFGIDY